MSTRSKVGRTKPATRSAGKSNRANVTSGKGPWAVQPPTKKRYAAPLEYTRDNHPNIGYIWGKHD